MSEIPAGPIALLSDVHGNAFAFEAVLEDIRQREIPTIINLGDVVGYGPDPEACIDLAQAHCTFNLCGNHEYAVLHSAEGFNPVAKSAVDYARKRLDPAIRPDDARAAERWAFLSALDAAYACDLFVAMHGSPRHAVMEYVLPSDPEVDPLKMDDVFDCMTTSVAFVGHTHFPGVIEERSDIFITTQTMQGSYTLRQGSKAVVNVGSVGQPRDRDIRSCYVEFDGRTAHYRRVWYDVERTVEKIQRSGALHESLGVRLREGR